MKLYKFYRRKTQWIDVDKEHAKIEYEFTIPSIIGDEQGLAKLANKNNLKILYKTEEGSDRPVTRVLRFIANFESISTSDKYVSKVIKILNTANIESIFRSSIIVPYFPYDDDFYGAVLANKITVSAIFNRRPDQNITILDFDPQWSEYSYHNMFLMRDSELAENEWRIGLYYLVHKNMTDFLYSDLEKFEHWAKNSLDATNFEYRIILEP